VAHCPTLPSRGLRHTAITNGCCVRSDRAHRGERLLDTQVPAQQIAWFLNQFDSLQGPSGQSWIIDVGPDVTDVVAVADGTEDLASMPRELIDAAAEWLGDPPQYRLALTIGDSPACRDLASRIANEFARWWPAVWSNHDSTEPAAPLGMWWRR
jgi:hypothetical protein